MGTLLSLVLPYLRRASFLFIFHIHRALWPVVYVNPNKKYVRHGKPNVPHVWY